MILKTYLFSFVLLTAVGQILDVYRNEISDVNICIRKLIEYIKGDQSIDVTVVNTDESLSKELHNIKGLEILSISFLWAHNPINHDIYIIESINCHELQIGIEHLKEDMFWNPKATFIISVKEMNNDLVYLSNLLKFHNIFNVTVVLKLNDMVGYSIFDFGSKTDDCHRPILQILQEVTTCSKFEIEPIYKLHIPKEMKNCRVKMLGRNYWPFMCFPPNTCLGIDAFVLKLWKESNNVTVDLKNIGSSHPIDVVFDEYPHFYRNQTVVYEGLIGGVVLNYNRTFKMDFSYPFTIDHNRIIVARSSFLGKWEVIVKQMTLLVVLLVIFLYITFTILSTYLSIFDKKSKDVTRNAIIVYGYFLTNIRVKRLSKRFTARIVILTMLIFVFMISNIVQAFLLSASTDPVRAHQVKDKYEVFKTHTPVINISWQRTYDRFDFDLEGVKNCTTLFNCVNEVVRNKHDKLFTVVSDMFFSLASYYMVDGNGMMQVYELPEPLGMLFRVTLFNRGSTLREPFDNHMERMIMGGIYDKHVKDIINKARRTSNMKELPAYLPTKIYDLKESFIILLTGYIISTFVFLCEYLTNVKNKKDD
ncbi:uncharacterized protein LOC128675855 [Plodia interpunctella]|uniref:uncharacterized protein LOC128675855 n=1 Tax=Plodia interpunctella TaxID=58824 RepID=UPI002367B319|nr:uncharacterized protein LOC128675855 [Plodia interpunctella]